MARIKILNVPVDPYTMTGAAAYLESCLQKNIQSLVVTANAEIVMLALRNPEYMQLLKSAQLVTADGAGIVWAGRHLGYKIPERVAGYDLFCRLLASSAQNGARVFFLGGKPGVAEEAAAKAESLYPGLQVAGCHDGYFSQEEELPLVEQINSTGAQIIFAALGAPKQEFWLQRYRDRLNGKILMGVGGSFDVLSGHTLRAPLWMQKNGLEWLYRLYHQPGRLGRILGTLPVFVWKVLCSRREDK